MLEEVGWVQQVIINQRTGNLVDGHLRCQLAAREGNKTIPVLYVDIDEAEEELVLATLDPIAAMAATDKAKLDELFQDIESENEQVLELLEYVGIRNGIIEPVIDYEKEWQGMPEFESKDIDGSAIICIVRFMEEKDIREFEKLIGWKLSHKGKTYSTWYPKQNFDQLGKGLSFTDEP